MQAGEASASLKFDSELKLQLKSDHWTCWMHRALEANAIPYISSEAENWYRKIP